MIKVFFKTFPVGHLVSDREFDKLAMGFSKAGMKLVREYDPKVDIVMVKGWSATWDEVKGYKKPVVYFSIGTEWKGGIDLKAANEPVRELYENADVTVHNSRFCCQITHEVFGRPPRKEYVIIPANPVNLPEFPHKLHDPIRCVSTAIWRPVKRQADIMGCIDRLKKEGMNITLDLYGTPAGPMLDDFSVYYDYDIYIQLSRKEGMPNTVLEAMSYGLPCIVSNYGGAKEAVMSAGVIVPTDPPDHQIWEDVQTIKPVNYDMFRAAFKMMVDNYDYYVAQTRQRVKEELNDEVTAEQFKRVFYQLI